MPLESDATFLKVNATTGAVSFSSILYADEYRLGEPIDGGSLPAGFASASDMPALGGRARKHDGKVVYEQAGDGSWSITGQDVEAVGGGGGGQPESLTITSVVAESADPVNLNTITIYGTGFTEAGIGPVRLKQNGGPYVAGAVGDGTQPFGRTIVDSHTITTMVQSADYDGTFGMVMDVGLLDPSAGNEALATPLVELAAAYTFPAAP